MSSKQNGDQDVFIDEVTVIRMITLNDVYAFDDPLSHHGGWSRAATLIEKLRRTNDVQRSIVTVNGDVLGGASLLQHSKGQLAIDILNHIQVDAVVLGNHEFDYGDEVLKSCIEKSNFKWLGSNVVTKNSDSSRKDHDHGAPLFPGVEDVWRIPLSSLSDEGNIQLNIFGVCTAATPHLSNPSKNTSFLPVVDTAKRVMSNSNDSDNNSNNVWVALTHISMNQDLELANAIDSAPPIIHHGCQELKQKLSVILGGHDHDAMVMDHKNNTLIFKCGQNGYHVGVVDLHISYKTRTSDNQTSTTLAEILPKQRKKVSVVPDSLKVNYSFAMHSTANIIPCPKIQSIVQRYQHQVDEKMMKQFQQQVVSSSTNSSPLQHMKLNDIITTISSSSKNLSLDTRTSSVRRHETTSGNMIADALLWYYTHDSTISSTCSISPCLAMINGGFIRGDSIYPPKTQLTVKNIMEEIPFPKDSVILEMKAKDLWQALEQQLEPLPAATATFPHLSQNVRLRYDGSTNKIISLTINDRPLDKDNSTQMYRVVCTTFISNGGDGCKAWCRGTPLQSTHIGNKNCMDNDTEIIIPPPKRLSLLVLEYLHNHQQLDLKLENRVLKS